MLPLPKDGGLPQKGKLLLLQTQVNNIFLQEQPLGSGGRYPYISQKRVFPAERGRGCIFQELASPLGSAYFPSEGEASPFGE